MHYKSLVKINITKENKGKFKGYAKVLILDILFEY